VGVESTSAGKIDGQTSSAGHFLLFDRDILTNIICYILSAALKILRESKRETKLK
jgi:hypothetical protein